MTQAPNCESWFEQEMVYQEQENYALEAEATLSASLSKELEFGEVLGDIELD